MSRPQGHSAAGRVKSQCTLMVEESQISRALNFYNAISVSYRRSQIFNSLAFENDLSAISKLWNELGTFIKVPLKKLIGCGRMSVNRVGRELRFVTILF
jgi:hypothetical protein